LTDLLIFFVVVLGVNLLPAFGPPTWAIIVLYGLNTRLPVPGLVIVGALAAATGRMLLALSFQLLAGRLSDKTKRNLAAARALVLRRKRNLVVGLGLLRSLHCRRLSSSKPPAWRGSGFCRSPRPFLPGASSLIPSMR
jgi:hypothetical protein